jgi:hypothetical protein
MELLAYIQVSRRHKHLSCESTIASFVVGYGETDLNLIVNLRPFFVAERR